MLRLAIYFENRLGRNDGNPLYIWACMKRMQEKKLLTIDHLIPNGDYDLFGRYDFNLHVDYAEDALVNGGLIPYKVANTPSPSLFWASDSHLDGGWRLNKAKEFDIIFFAQKEAVETFNKENSEKKAIWLPHAVEPLAYPRIERPGKTYDVCFVGHVNSQNRIDALDRLFKEFPNFYYGQRLFEDAAQKYAESKIIFNNSMRDDLNMRTFECMATGSFLLTSWNSTIEEFFKDGVHCAIYHSEEDMIEKARYYIAHDEEREKIAQAGCEEVLKNHTIDCRVNVMLSEIKNFLKAGNLVEV